MLISSEGSACNDLTTFHPAQKSLTGIALYRGSCSSHSHKLTNSARDGIVPFMLSQGRPTHRILKQLLPLPLAVRQNVVQKTPHALDIGHREISLVLTEKLPLCCLTSILMEDVM